MDPLAGFGRYTTCCTRDSGASAYSPDTLEKKRIINRVIAAFSHGAWMPLTIVTSAHTTPVCVRAIENGLGICFQAQIPFHPNQDPNQNNDLGFISFTLGPKKRRSQHATRSENDEYRLFPAEISVQRLGALAIGRTIVEKHAFDRTIREVVDLTQLPVACAVIPVQDT